MRTKIGLFILLFSVISISTVQAFQITQISLTGAQGEAPTILEIQFSASADPDSFTLADDFTFTGTSGAIDPEGFAWPSADLLQVTFADGLDGDVYTLAVGPQITAADDGSAMDQDDDGTAGETGEDVYRAAIVTHTAAISDTDTTYDGSALVVRGVTVTLDGTHSFGMVHLLEGATLTHSAATSDTEYQMEIIISGELKIDSTSSIDVTGKGYLPGYTIGNTTEGGATGDTESDGSAGSYGGLGGGETTNWTYGDFTNPNRLGSGGSRTGNGGGLVRITAGTAEINGSIHANGYPGYRSTAGSGGGIRLDVGTLSGSGTITADGGTQGLTFQGGGGGRIAVYAETFDGFDYETQVTAYGGSSSAGDSYRGGAGTVYIAVAGDDGELRIDNNGVLTGQWTPIGQTSDEEVTIGKLVVTGAVAAPDHDLVISADNVSIVDEGYLTHRYTDETAEYALKLNVTNQLSIDSNASINVSGRGYLPGYTIGNTTEGGATGDTESDGSAGSYGGLGGGETTNWTYGDFTNPNKLGSGGSRTGNGGGLVRITAGTAEINGSIHANGYPGYRSTAGSGGGIRLDVGTLSGSGTITADGGTQGLTFQGGGGGRIAVYAETFDGFDYETQVTAYGGSSNAGDSYRGGAGTVYIAVAGEDGELRIDNNGVANGQWTPLGISSDTRFDVAHLVISGATAAAMNGIPIIVDDIALENSGALTHMAATDRMVYGLHVIAKERFSIDDTSSVDVYGRGYLPGRSKGNVYFGGADSSSGGSYGGLGAGTSPGDIYGSETMPDEPGAGGSITNGSAGGGFVHIIADALDINGAVRANGETHYSYGVGAGSGGAVVISAGTLSGSGTIEADGGYATYGGGGGRIAVYTWASNGFSDAQMHASGSNQGDNGTVHVSADAQYAWLGADRTVLHDTEYLKWTVLGANPLALTARVTATCNGTTATVGTWPAEKINANWDTTAMADGLYTLTVRFMDASGTVVGSAARQITVNNALTWHSGYVDSDETWEAGTVHAVDGILTLAEGVTLTVEAGAIVKFTIDGGIVVSDSATLNLEGEALSPTYLTAICDDAVGADDNYDGDNTVPTPGDWIGFYVMGTGTVTQNDYVAITYTFTTHSGAISGNEVWRGAQTHYVTADVTVGSGVTLTIEPGAVVKFADLTGLVVASGGVLTAYGNTARPVILTSEKDDSAGGDTNGDGSDTTPAAGNWKWIRVQDGGIAQLDHARLTYGGGTAGVYDYNGALRTDTGAVLTVSNSRIEESFYEGVVANGGTVTLTSTIITATDRAVNAAGDSTITLVNCTLDDNRIGIWEHGGALDLFNTIVSNSSETGVIQVFNAVPIDLSFCNVWSATGTNYENMADPTGTSGNISVDPAYEDKAQKNYRLGYASPCIDAADTPAAPETDYAGAPRYDDPRTANTGVADGSGAYGDMGAYEFVETAESNVDLVVNWVRGPADAEAGTDVTVSWQITNTGSEPAVGPWHDQLRLVAGEARRGVVSLDAGSVLNSRDLGPGQSGTCSGTVTVPGGTEGTWYWQVKANATGDVFEGANSENNLSPLSDAVAMTVALLDVDGSVDSAFDEAGNAAWYKINQPAGQELLVTLDVDAESGRTRIYAGTGSMPTITDFDAVSRLTDGPDNRLSLTAPEESQTVYLLVMPEALSGGNQPYTLSAGSVGFELTGLGVTTGGNTGEVSVPLIGTGFGNGLSAALVNGSDTRIEAVTVTVTDSGNAMALFDLSGQDAATFDVEATLDGETSTLSDAFTIAAGTGGQLEAYLVMPDTVRIGRPFEGVIEFSNIGDANLPIPMLILAGDETDFPVWADDETEDDARGSIRYLAAPEEGTSSGVLYPGESHAIRFMSYTNVESAEYVLYEKSGDAADAVDWEVIRAAVAPGDADETWSDKWDAFVDDIGEAWGDFIAYLSDALDEARHYGQALSRKVSDVFAYVLDRSASVPADANVSGTLYTEDTDHPTGEATVTLVDPTHEDNIYVVTTWIDGSFALTDVSAGTYNVYVGDDLGTVVSRITVPETGNVTDWSLVMSQGGRVSGRVVDVDTREGIEDATVIVSSLDGESAYAATTGADGYFAVTCVNENYYAIQVTADGYVDAGTDAFELEEDAAYSTVIELAAAGGIAGQILDGSGDPVALATVSATGPLAVKSVETDASGNYEIRSLPEGSYSVAAVADGYAPGERADVAVITGGTTPDQDIVLNGGTARMVVTVTDADSGQGIADASLGLRCRRFYDRAGDHR